MRYPTLTPFINDCTEIRMGSPYQVCDLKLKGSWVPELPEYEWQNIFAKSSNGRYLALVAWDVKDNSPGFKVLIIDSKEKMTSETERIPGCCETLEWDGLGFTYRVFSHLPERSFASLKTIGNL